MIDILVDFFSAMLRMSTPLILGTIGEAFAELSGVLNLGIEGMMLMGAAVGFSVTYFTGNLWLGLLAAAAVGMLMGILMAFMTVTIGASQHVSGIGTTIMGMGLALFLHRILFGTPASPPQVTPFGLIEVPILSQIPVLGPILFRQYALVYIALILVPISYFVLYRTDLGLDIRAVGQNPRAADTVGINVTLIRYGCLAFAGALAAVSGAWLSISHINMFLPGMTAGRGWICIALVIFGNWAPHKILGGALIFGGIDALQLRLQALGFGIPYPLFLMMPYVFTVIALVLVARGVEYPAALLKPYRREE